MNPLRRFASNYIFCAVLLLIAVKWNTIAYAQNLPPEVIAYPDIIVYNGKILTADEKFTIVEAVAIRDGKFLALGTTDRILKMAGPKTRKVDLRGRSATPGLVDPHQHPFTQGVVEYWDRKWLPAARMNKPWANLDEMLADVKRATGLAKPGEVVMIPRMSIGLQRPQGRKGFICDEMTLAQLDAASPDIPVIFTAQVNLSAVALNSKAAELIKPFLPAGSPVFFKEGNACIAQGAGSDDDGVLPPAVQAVNDYVYWTIPLEEQVRALKEATATVSSHGITMVKEHTAPPLLTAIRELWLDGELTVRLRMPFPLTAMASGQSVEIPPAEAKLIFRRMGNISGIGDDMWKFFGIRPPALGGNFRGGDVWTFEPKLRPYPDRWGNPSPYGGRIAEQAQAATGEAFRGRQAVVEAVRFGWSVSADHTVGDRAVYEVLKAYEEGKKSQIVKGRHQVLTIDHTPMARQQEIQKMKDMGVRVTIGPWHVFANQYFEGAIGAYGTERVNQMLPIGSYVKLGIKPSLEGDTYDYPPFWRMEKAVNRKDDAYSRKWNPSEAVSRQEALWMGTSWAAYTLEEDKKVGTIEVGKLGDLVVIDKDYMTIPEDEIHTIKPLMTVLGGKVVYEVEGAFK